MIFSLDGKRRRIESLPGRRECADDQLAGGTNDPKLRDRTTQLAVLGKSERREKLRRPVFYRGKRESERARTVSIHTLRVGKTERKARAADQ